jgi:uncharacterized protein GlcG (DUF336 family)
MKQPALVRPRLELLEDRTLPALIASQIPLAALPALNLTRDQVAALLDRAAAATASDDAIVAVVDRGGNILGVRVEGNVSPVITGSPTLLDFSVDGAVALARTGAQFSSNSAPLTSRAVRFISQTSITQRMVDSSFYVADTTSPLYGPGFVAPIGPGGNFPPGVNNTPLVDLFGIELTNRVATGVAGSSVLSYAATVSPVGTGPPSRGVATLPGGLPIYEDGVLVGGIGVFFPGTTGYASAENSSLSADFNPKLPDRTLEAEFIAFAAIGGSSQAGFSVGTLGGVPALPGFDLPFPQIDLAGITIDEVGPGGDQGPSNLFNFAKAHFAIGMGSPLSGAYLPVDPAADLLKAGVSVPDGWLVAPHDGVGITAAQVSQIIDQGVSGANNTRAQIRTLGNTAKMVFAVTDETGAILGLYRMPDATVFSIDVAIAKARNVAYYDNPALLEPVDLAPGLPPGVSFTARTFRFLAQPYYPEGINGSPPGPFSDLNDPGINPATGLQTGPALPASAYSSELGFAAFNPAANFHSPAPGNGVVFFPGSAGVYTTAGGSSTIIGGLGVSGDGVNQDDFVTAAADAGFAPVSSIRADEFFVRGIRLPYLKFPRNPEEE